MGMVDSIVCAAGMVIDVSKIRLNLLASSSKGPRRSYVMLYPIKANQ